MKYLPHIASLSFGSLGIGMSAFLAINSGSTTRQDHSSILVKFYKKTETTTKASSSVVGSSLSEDSPSLRQHNVVYLDDEGKSSQPISKSSSSSSFSQRSELQVVTTTASSSAPEINSLFAKFALPLSSLGATNKYKYCFINSATTAAAASTTSPDCVLKDLSHTSEDKKKAFFLAKLAIAYITAQHYSNIYNAAEEVNTAGKPSSTTTTASSAGCCCPPCKSGSTTCVTDVTAATADKLKNFYSDLRNLSSSFDSTYLAPTEVLIFLPKIDDKTFEEDSSTTTSSVVTTDSSGARTYPTYTLHGLLIYQYLNYYYKPKSNPDLTWSHGLTKSAGGSAGTTTASSAGTGTDVFVNYPICFQYTFDKTKNKYAIELIPLVSSQPTLDECFANLVHVYETWTADRLEATKSIKTTFDNSSHKIKDVKKAAKLSQLGTISSSNLSQLETWMKTTATCTKN